MLWAREKKSSDVLQWSKSKIFGDKSYEDNLNMERGIVEIRVAFVLQSEIKPLFHRFVTLWQVILFKKTFWFPLYYLRYATFPLACCQTNTLEYPTEFPAWISHWQAPLQIILCLQILIILMIILMTLTQSYNHITCTSIYPYTFYQILSLSQIFS